MAGEWKETLLRELLVTTKDGDWGKETPEDGYVPYHIIRGTDFPDVRVGDLSSVPQRYLPENTVKRRTLEPGDILIETAGGTRDRPTGRTLLITEKVLSRFRGPVTCASFARFLRIDCTQADPRFVFWYLQHLYNKGEMSQHQVQHTGVARFQYTRFAETQNVPLPPIAEQKAIAAVLGELDDKIELNRRMNATLEAMARALFQSWFVDFDPVRAKLDGRPLAGLDPATAALFPDSFQDSELGNIPMGWNVGVLDNLTSFVIGGDWGAAESTDDESVSCYCIRGADIPSLQEGGVGKMPTRFLKPSSVEKRQLMDGDLVIEISGGSPNQCTGRPVLVSDGLLRSLGRPLVASNFCRIVKLKSHAFSKFVYCWLRSLYDAGSLFQFETGTTGIKNFAFVLFSEKYPLVVPDPRIAEAFDRTVSPLFARIQANAHQSRALATLRDTLLPKLLSGELTIETT